MCPRAIRGPVHRRLVNRSTSPSYAARRSSASRSTVGFGLPRQRRRDAASGTTAATSRSASSRRIAAARSSVSSVVAANGIGDVGQVAHAARRHQRADLGRARVRSSARALRRRDAHRRARSSSRRCWYTAVTPSSLNRAATLPNTGRSSSRAERFAVPGHLTADVAERILGAAPLELVDHDQVGEVEHVDLLELGRGAVLGRHDVDRHVGQRDDRGITLTDARRLHDDEVESRHPAGVDHRRQRRRDLLGRHRVSRSNGRTPAASWPPPCECDHRAARRRPAVSRDRRRARRRGPCPAGRVESQQQLVGERRLARASGAGDAHDRRDARCGGSPHLAERIGGHE